MALLNLAGLNNLGSSSKAFATAPFVNTGYVKNSSNVLAGYGQNAHQGALSALGSITNSAKGMTSTFSGITGSLGKEISNLDFGKAASEAASPFKTAFNNVLGDSSKALGGLRDNVTSFANQFSPNNWSSNPLGTFQNLANVLMCPEAMLLPMFTNAFDSIMGSVARNLQPKELLTKALGNLMGSIVNQLPSLNLLVSFVEDIASYLGTLGFDSKDVLNGINEVLYNFGLTPDYVRDVKVVDDLIKSIERHVNANDKNGTYVPVIVPQFEEDRVRARCSVIAKIISKLLASYRDNNRFDDLQLRAAVLDSVRDPKLKADLARYMDYDSRKQSSYNASLVAARNGFFGDTAINNVLSVAIENKAIIDETDGIIKGIKEGTLPPSVENKIKILKNLAYLDNLNKDAYDKIVAFEEELGNISEEASNYYLIGLFNELDMAKKSSGYTVYQQDPQKYQLLEKDILTRTPEVTEIRKRIKNLTEPYTKGDKYFVTLDDKLNLLELAADLSPLNRSISKYIEDGLLRKEIDEVLSLPGMNQYYHPLAIPILGDVINSIILNTAIDTNEAYFKNIWNGTLEDIIFVLSLEFDNDEDHTNNDKLIDTTYFASTYKYEERLELYRSLEKLSSDNLDVHLDYMIEFDNNNPVNMMLKHFYHTKEKTPFMEKYVANKKIGYSSIHDTLTSYYIVKKLHGVMLLKLLELPKQ